MGLETVKTWDARDITVVSVCYGDYWDKFSDAWIEAISMLDPAPAEVILVSDVPRDIAGVRNLVMQQDHMADYFNAAAMAAGTEWVLAMGFDDLLMPEAMSSFATDADAYGYPMMMTGAMQGFFGYSGGFESILDVSHNPMLGGCIHRRRLLEEIPWRRFGWFDWAHFAEMRYFDRTFDSGEMPRAFMVRHDRAHSLRGDSSYQHEMDHFKAQLRSGLIEIGGEINC